LLVSIGALIVSHFPRTVAAIRFRQSWLGAACHCLATPLLVLLQWLALRNYLSGRAVTWRGRVQ
jgi:hypothetical protein